MKGNKKVVVFFVIFLISFFFSCNISDDSKDDDDNNVQVDKKYGIRMNVIISNKGATLTRLVVVIPLAQTNQYQDVQNVNLFSGTKVAIPKTDDFFIRWIYTKSVPSTGQKKESYYDFDVTLHPYNFNFSQVTTIPAYDTKSNIYLWYTGGSGDLIDPRNSTIMSIGKSLWGQSSDIIDYARRCYEYVAKNYKYKNPNTGLHSLKEILAAGGGDCGNLSSIYISLLRYKDIPSRHIVTVRPNGSFHVWADFYIQNYGWVPVDVTSKNSNPNGDFFGKYDGNGIVFTKEVWLQLNIGDQKQYCALLQSYAWWFWGLSGLRNVDADFVITSTRLN